MSIETQVDHLISTLQINNTILQELICTLTLKPTLSNPGIIEKTHSTPTTITLSTTSYQEVRKLILELAHDHRDKIKELNKKHGLTTFADILINPDDPDAGVKDSLKLSIYYDELLKLKGEV